MISIETIYNYDLTGLHKYNVNDIDIDYDNYTNILFINTHLEKPSSEFSHFLNTATYPLVYNYSIDRDSIINFINKFKNIKRIAFAFHGASTPGLSANTSFINTEKYYTDEDISDNQTVFSENVSFIKNLTQQFSLTNIDFLACNLLANNDWKKYFTLLQNDSNVIVGASDDDTGNIKYGGDWVLENTMENIKSVYFNDSIISYASILSTVYYSSSPDYLNYNLYTNTLTASVVSISSGHSTTVIIPGTITYLDPNTNISSIYTVTQIGAYAFKDKTNIHTVTISAPIYYIGNAAFSGTTNMTSITLPDTLSSFGSVANHIMTDTFFRAGLTSIEIPRLVPSIGIRVFSGCANLKTITFAPNSVCTKIFKWAFENNPNLTSISLPDSLTLIGGSSIKGSKLSSITIPRNVTIIERK